MAIFTNPENVLKRADELIKVGQTGEALQVLHDLVTSRMFRSWQKSHENIMFRYVELCVDLRNIQFAKDGLIQYRSQQVNVTSFEEVTKYLLRLATEKAEQERNQADAPDKDKSDFLWETFRMVLEILRNNLKLEELYKMTAYQAFQFCKKYKRTSEFRRLCEIIRYHLENLNKYRDQRNQPDLTVPETLQLYLDIRFEQLKVATELGLSQEAFRSVEDIYGLMCMVQKTPESSLLMVYYSKLIEIFWISSTNLYHAYAWLKLFSLQKTFNKNLSQKDLQLIASSVVLAALSVPPFEDEKEHNLKMANLIRFNLDPEFDGGDKLSWESLLSELVSRGVLSCATHEVKDLYQLMEHEFHPLDLGSKIKPLLDRISELASKLSSASSLPAVQLSQYVPSLEKLATLRLLKQVSKVYQTIRIKSLAQLIPFFDFSAVEKIAVDAVKHNFVSMKVDHVMGVIIFDNLDTESDGLRDPLAIFTETMNKVRAMFSPAPSKASSLSDLVPTLEETVEKEHKRLLARKSIIEKRKEEQEHQQLEKEREEEQAKLKLLKQIEEAEQKRLATELEERKRQRILMEIEKRDLEEAQALLKGKKMTFLNGEKVTKQTVMERAISEKKKENQEKEKKLKKLAKLMDHLERAKREEEAPIIKAAYQKRQREFYEDVIEISRKRHEFNLIEKHRLARMSDNKDIFKQRVLNARQAELIK